MPRCGYGLDMVLGRLGNDVADSGAGQLADSLGEPRVQPLREPHGQRRDDDLVKALRIPDIGDGYERVGTADKAVGLQSRLAQLGDRLLQLLRGRVSPPA